MEHGRVAVFAFFLVVYFSAGYARTPTKMMNDIDARIEDFPSTAVLWVDGVSRCGGIIYDEKHILTVAHCIEDLFKQMDLKTYRIGDYGVYIVAGTTEYGPEHNPDVEFAIEEMIMHPNYTDDPMLRYDIGIIKLKKAISFNEYRKPMRRPKAEAPESGDAMAIGFDWVAHRKLALKRIPMRIVPRDICYPHYQPQLQSQMCGAQNTEGRLCPGDSGTPLIFEGEAVGMLSVGTIPCKDGVPVVYTHIHSFLDWIDEVVAS